MAETHHMRTKAQTASHSFALLNKEAESRCREIIKNNQQAPMPSMNHLKSMDYQQVYEPSDDTFLLLDALYLDFYLSKRKGNDSPKFSLDRINSLEVGCGTGVATILLGQILRNRLKDQGTIEKFQDSISCRHFITDINEYALETALITANENFIDVCYKMSA